MKKFIVISICILLCSTLNLSAQMVDRQFVLVEKVTGLECTYCPGAANGLHDMIAEGLKVAPVNYHWAAFDKVFNNDYATKRITYYFPKNPHEMGAPTAIFDGTTRNTAAGGAGISVYNKYIPDYETAINKKSPMYIDISCVETKANEEWEITVTVTKKELSFDLGYIMLHTVLTESNIPCRWLGMETVEHAERKMYPNATGIKVVFDSENKFVYKTTVKMDDDWKFYNCNIVAFVQDNGDKSVHQANQIKLSDKILAAPKDVEVKTEPCTTSLDLAWKDGEYEHTTLIGYDIYNNMDKVNTDVVTSNSYTVQNAIDGDNCISLVAVYDAGKSHKSDPICKKISYPSTATNLTNKIENSSVILNWNKPINTGEGEMCELALVGYNVYRDDKKINQEPIKETIFTDYPAQTGSYNYYVTAQYTKTESDKSNLITADVTLVGIENIALQKTAVHPNPVSSATNYILTIDSDKKEINCIITDLAGKKILETKETNINMSKLKDGMYIVTVSTNNGNKTFRIIKKK